MRNMPAILGFFILLQGLSHAHTFGREVAQVDFGIERGPKFTHTYRVWTAPMYEQYTRDDHCVVTFFALATHRVEILTDGVFVHDTALTVTEVVPADYSITKEFLFSVEGEGTILARRQVAFRCYGLPGSGAPKAATHKKMEGIR